MAPLTERDSADSQARAPSVLPALAVSKAVTAFANAKEKRSKDPNDQSVAINTLCKSYSATLTKLMYSFAALQAESVEGAGSQAASIGQALQTAKREELLSKIIETLAHNVEKIIRAKDVTMRTHVLRDIRARFSPEKTETKVETTDVAVQAAPPQPATRRTSMPPRLSLKAAAATGAAVRMASPADALQQEPQSQQQQQPQQQPAGVGPTDEEILQQLQRGDEVATSEPSAAAAASTASAAPGDSATAGAPDKKLKEIQGFGRSLARAAASKANASAGAGDSAAPSARSDVASSEGGSSRPASASTSLLPGIYERQMKWAAKAAEKREAARVEKENREREEGKPAPVDKRHAGKWAHVESVMRKQRLASEENWRSEMNDKIAAETDRREQAEARAREEKAERQRLQVEKDHAEEKRREAFEKMDACHARMLAAERKYEEARKAQEELQRRHAEEMEVRDAFGEKGLEVWPMFPGKKLFRTLEPEAFDGRVSQEFRTKDAESGERGVTLLMGRLASGVTSEAQAVLFDTKKMTDLDAARWWESNRHRFEQVKERVKREQQRAQSAQGTSRTRM